MFVSGLRRAALALVCTVSAAAAAPAVAATTAEPLVEAVALKAGEYRLAGLADGVSDAVSVLVSIADQRAYVYRGDRLVAVSTVSTGMDGHDTPTGEFTILQKNATHRSNIYDGAPMPYMQRLTWDGIALHAGKIPGHRASHGCVRLPLAFAKQLFKVTQMGASVRVTDEAFISDEIMVEAPNVDFTLPERAPLTIALDMGPLVKTAPVTLAMR